MQIGVLQARQMAEAAFEEYWGEFLADLPEKWTSEDYLVVEAGWLFLRNEEIDVNKGGPFSDFVIFIGRNGRRITKHGCGRDMKLLTDFGVLISEYLSKRESEPKSGIEDNVGPSDGGPGQSEGGPA